MHVGKGYNEDICPELKIDGRKVKQVNQISPSEVELQEDKYTGMHTIGSVAQEKYLEHICFGKHHFVVAMILRNALLISSMLTNAEARHNITMTEIAELEKVDESLLRKVLESPASTPKEMLYLELGVSPIRNIIKSRRLNFLHYILHEEKESLLYKFLQAQFNELTKND